MKKTDFDLYTQNYNRFLREQTIFFTRREAYFAYQKTKIVREKVSFEPNRILEFGCGIGGNIPFLRKMFQSSEIMGSDVSALSLDVARQSNPGIYFWCEGQKGVGFDNFDLIFIAGVFHHILISERLDIVKLLYTRLVPGGSLFVFEHNPYNPVTCNIVRNCPYDKGVILLRPYELDTLLQQGGLEIVERGFSLFFPPWLKWILPLERYLGWLPLGGQYWVFARKPDDGC